MLANGLEEPGVHTNLLSFVFKLANGLAEPGVAINQQILKKK